LNGISPVLRLAHRRHNQRRQDSDDRNYDHEFNQGEGCTISIFFTISFDLKNLQHAFARII
jgi:hypothetical protein